MKIILGADHAGYKLKEIIKKFLIKKKIEFEDTGTNSTEPVDYPDYAKKVARKIQKNKNNRGILVCGSGTGMCIAANRFKKIRAVSAYDEYSAKMSRKDNDSNILCLRGRKFNPKKAKKLVNIWLKEKFSNKKRHKRRIRKL
ncbi:ribose 5-phosphate isomerase B [Candidatus Woesearchaeota archaeon]|nr:ribose 5-phosphate isomerase B [Candidatus Woesearchaeota archaeon]